MTATWDGLGLRWTASAGTEVPVEETGTGASHPAGGLCVVTLVPPEDQTVLCRVRDHAEVLAALLEIRAGRSGHAQG